MSKKLLYLPVLMMLAIALFTTSCGSDDPCKDVDCGANGSCLDGSCVCNEGYEGSACADEWATKFAGTWKAAEVCNGDIGTNVPNNYNATVTEVDAFTIRVTNFGAFNLANSVDLKVSRVAAADATATKLTATNFVDSQNRKHTVTGELSASGTTITVNYTTTYDDNTTDVCTGTWTKQ